jgi:phosphoribosylglycinamide formyltransferase 1
MRVAVLASGSGSNFEALATRLQRPGAPAQVAALVCNVPGALALERARRLGVPSVVLDHRDFPSRAAHDAALAERLSDLGAELVCLAGYMRLVGPAFLGRFGGRTLNLHPALLPSFPGLHAVRQALEAGVRVSGCTVHVVDEGTDTGPIIAQAAVPVLPADTEASLGARIHAEEHRLYPLVVEAWASGRVRLEGRRVHLDEDLR